MLFTEETDRRGNVRIYATQQASVVTYFEDDGDGGTMLHAEPGEFLSPYVATPELFNHVRAAVLTEAAKRLSCPIDKVLARSMSELALVCDPVLSERPTWTGRRHKRTPAR
ncbi:hypothetical protein [Hyphomicrobium sp. DY-1]|uniref:hypothetical protein n=1 Tax=Hyphomicrobium sp. DY-1 TaxID=3075650 RepID=UPI0039C38C09